MIQVRGVHPIAGTAEPVYLIDIAIDGSFDDFEWDSITQADPAQPHENWQAVYDEQELGVLPNGQMRAIFFFHYLDPSRPLQSRYGDLLLPPPSAVPVDLREVEYFSPWSASDSGKWILSGIPTSRPLTGKWVALLRGCWIGRGNWHGFPRF